MSENTPETFAAPCVGYCNGGPETKWGKVRAEPRPYRALSGKVLVHGQRTLLLWPGRVESGDVCASRTRLFAQPMKAVDPTISLTGCTPPRSPWNKTLIDRAGPLLDSFSVHDYLLDSYRGKKTWRSSPRRPRITCGRCCTARNNFAKLLPAGRLPVLTFDEWNTMWGRSAALGWGFTRPAC